VQKYKTVKTYAAWEKDLTSEYDELTKIIKTSLAKEPRKVLFTQSNGEPFGSVIAYTQFTNRILKRHLGEKVTLNSIRHAASKENTMGNTNRSDREIEQYAFDMGHSFEMHRKYRYIKPPV
jgi:hypothetical protein